MSSLVVVNFISLDGVIQAPLRADEDTDGGFAHGGWVQPYMDDTVAEFMSSSTSNATGMLPGRRTYENFVDDWDQADATDPAIAAMNRMPNLRRHHQHLPPASSYARAVLCRLIRTSTRYLTCRRSPSAR